jgi:hypothetical protein
MTEEDLRALVRDAIARHGIGRAPAATPASPMLPVHLHASHTLIAVPAGGDGDGLCIIEPAVTCNHCGYCKSLGH